MTLPELIVDPRALSPEHHLLRRLSREEPRSLRDVLHNIARLYPEFTRLGTPHAPTPAARNAWHRLSQEQWTGTVRRGAQQGLVLTDAGAERLELLWTQQVITPYLRRVEHELGPEAARRAAESLR